MGTRERGIFHCSVEFPPQGVPLSTNFISLSSDFKDRILYAGLLSSCMKLFIRVPFELICGFN